MVKNTKPATVDDIADLIALVREAKRIDVLVPDGTVRSELGNPSVMTWYRWERDEALLALGFPPAIKIRDRTFRSRYAVEAFKKNLMMTAVKERLLKRGRPRNTPA